MELTVNGLNVYAYTGTRPLNAEQATVVFLHGAAMDHSLWLLQSRYFAHHGYNALALDLPGHGRSEGDPLTTIGALADWLDGVLADVADAGRVTLVGHSMGSLIALETAARYPQRIERIALLGSALPMAVAKPLLAAAEADDPAAIEMIINWSFSPSSHLGGNRAPGLWLAGGGRRLLEQAKRGVLYCDLNACNSYRDGLESAAKVRCPALLISGGQDMMTSPKAAQPLLNALPDVRTQVLPRCGHMMPVERPEETLDALIEFIKSRVSAQA